MADTTQVAPSDNGVKPASSPSQKPRPLSRQQQLNQLYALPAPLRTFPLPTFVPHNPLSLFHVLYAWLSQTIKPQPSHFETLYQGWFSPDTRSVHVTDLRSIRGLWEQGFYGKGSLSRSEPSWLNREKTRRGEKAKTTSEENTRLRRAERQQAKWERARKEREAIDQKLLEEAETALGSELKHNGDAEPTPVAVAVKAEGEVQRDIQVDADINAELTPTPIAVEEVGPLVVEVEEAEMIPASKPPNLLPSPVGPLELLSLPNSQAELLEFAKPQNNIPTLWSLLAAGLDAQLTQHFSASPVSPLELLPLPNSHVELEQLAYRSNETSVESSYPLDNSDIKLFKGFNAPPVEPLELLALPNTLRACDSLVQSAPESLEQVRELAASPHDNRYNELEHDHEPLLVPDTETNGTIDGLASGLGMKDQFKVEETEVAGGSDTNDEAIDSSTHSEDTVETNTTAPNGSALVNGNEVPGTPRIKRQKSVRFSPTVEKNTFIQTEPPSPERAGTRATIVEEQPLIIKNQEHTQLTLEEAFFLSYGLGAIQILDPETKEPIPNRDLFTLFRKTSYFPPVANPILSPDDPFMINYVVYHHFRSLGWVPRSGVKFSVDLMLYNRGPVFTHAEFGVLILPSYSDPYWSSDVFLQNYVKGKETRTWAWMSCINRVITQVKKTLILAYVDIPKPLDVVEEERLGVDEILARYKVREVTIKRWSSNRSRN